MSNCEIYFPTFSENIHTILKIFSQRGLGSVGRGYCGKNRVLEFLAKIFGQVASASLISGNETEKKKFYDINYIRHDRSSAKKLLRNF